MNNFTQNPKLMKNSLRNNGSLESISVDSLHQDAVFGRKSFNKFVSALGLMMLLLVGVSSFGQTNIFTYSNSTATIPTGFVLTNNVSTNAIDQSSYLLLDAGSPSDYIVTPSYNLSAYTTATINVNVATFGTGTAYPMKIEFSTNGGTSWNATTYTTTTPSSSTYITGGPIVITQTFSSTTQFRFSNNGTSGRGVRVQSLTLDASGSTAITSAQSGNWSSTSTWVGGVVPSSSANVIIASGHTVTMDTTTSGINTRNSGTTTTVTGTLATAVQYINNGTLTINGTFQLNASGSITGTAPLYAANSLLKYNTGANPQGRGIEWGLNASGTSGTTAGYPFSVQLSNNTILNYPNSANYTANQIAGSLTVDSGSALYMDYGSPASNGALSVLGNVTFNGNVSLGNASGGDLNVGGNWTRTAATSTINYKTSRVVTFNGTGTQVISLTAGGTESIPFVVIGGSGTVQLSSSPATSLTVTGSSGLTLGSSNGTSNIDLNGQTLTINGGGNLSVGGSTRNITSSTGTGTLAVTTTGLTVTNTTGGKLVTGNNVLVAVSTSLNFGSGITTIGGGTSGTLQLNGGYGVSNSPFYAAGSTLQYNSAGPPGRSTEWTLNSTGTSGTTAGYPFNVQISNSTTLNYPNGAYTANQIAGSLTVDSGSAFYMDYSSPSTNGILTVLKDVSISGNFSLGNQSTGNLYVGGNWTLNSTNTVFNTNSRLIRFNGGAAQTIGGTKSTPFASLEIANTSGGVSLSTAATVSGVLTLTSGILTTTATNSLTVNNTASTAITGGSSTCFVNGPLTWALPNTSSTNYIYPIGATSTYLPFAITNPGGSTPVVTMQAFGVTSGGTADGTTLTSISSSE